MLEFESRLQRPLELSFGVFSSNTGPLCTQTDESKVVETLQRWILECMHASSGKPYTYRSEEQGMVQMQTPIGRGTRYLRYCNLA